MPLIVYCADIGSVCRGNFRWVRLAVSELDAACSTGRDMGAFADGIASDLKSGTHVAVGFECPLFIPAPEDPPLLIKCPTLPLQRMQAATQLKLSSAPGAETENPMEMIALNFIGPFTFMDRPESIFRAPCARDAGIYLWTVKQRRDNAHLVHYVGESVSFGKRHREHLINILGLNYGIFDPDKAQDGMSELLWPGLWRSRSPDGPSKQIDAYGKIHLSVLKYLSILSVFFAPVEVETRLRRHIEGCIGWSLRNNHPEFKALYPDDNHVGTISERNRGELVIAAPVTIRGLDERIQY